MLYDHPIGQLFVNQPHDSFVTVLVITGVTSNGDQPHGVGLQKLAPQQFIACVRDCKRFDKHLDISDL